MHVSDELLVHHQEHRLVNCITQLAQSAQWCRRARLACTIVPTACTIVPTAWYSLLDSAPDDGRVIRPKHVEQVKNSEIKKIICKKLCILLVHLHNVDCMKPGMLKSTVSCSANTAVYWWNKFSYTKALHVSANSSAIIGYFLNKKEEC